MHALYHLAAKSQLLDFVMEDSLTLRTRQLSLSDIYKRALLLSRSRFNQLRPSEIRQVNKALCLWAPHSNIEPVEKSRSHFVVNQDSDEGLLYTALSPGDSNSHLLALDSRLLGSASKKTQRNAD